MFRSVFLFPCRKSCVWTVWINGINWQITFCSALKIFCRSVNILDAWEGRGWYLSYHEHCYEIQPDQSDRWVVVGSKIWGEFGTSPRVGKPAIWGGRQGPDRQEELSDHQTSLKDIWRMNGRMGEWEGNMVVGLGCFKKRWWIHNKNDGGFLNVGIFVSSSWKNQWCLCTGQVLEETRESGPSMSLFWVLWIDFEAFSCAVKAGNIGWQTDFRCAGGFPPRLCADFSFRNATTESLGEFDACTQFLSFWFLAARSLLHHGVFFFCCCCW